MMTSLNKLDTKGVARHDLFRFSTVHDKVSTVAVCAAGGV
jgi:hypothetical protein